MAARLPLAFGAIALLALVAVVLLVILGRDAADRAVGEWLIRQATTDEEYALVFVTVELHDLNAQHHAFACAVTEAGLDGLDAGEVASALGLPAGEWQPHVSGLRDGVPYVIVTDQTRGPGASGSFDWRSPTVSGLALTCLVPIA